jgi:hypothetical protein
MRFPDTRRDVRWQNLNMFPISILLLICNIVNIGVLSAYTSISSYYLDSFRQVIDPLYILQQPF